MRKTNYDLQALLILVKRQRKRPSLRLGWGIVIGLVMEGAGIGRAANSFSIRALCKIA